MAQRKINIGGKEIELLAGLGSGSYGEVFLINLNGEQKAIKIITNTGKEGIKSLRELDIMSRLVHPNIVRAEGIIVGIDRDKPPASTAPLKIPGLPDLVPILPPTPTKEKVTVGIVMPLAQTDLQRLLKLPTFDINQKIKILYDITSGLKYLHDNNVLHLDLKPMNVLIYTKGQNTKDQNTKDQNIEGRLTDFGISLYSNDINKYYPIELVTITHRAPEILNGNRYYTRASDIWSLGIIFLEVLSGGKTIFPDFAKSSVKSVINKLFNIKNIDNTLNTYLSGLPQNIKTESINLIKRLLSFDPTSRPTVDQILSSPLFKNFRPTNMGTVTYKLPYQPRKCDIIYYYGFDFMVRIAMKLAVTTETFFLAADIYQRALAYANKLTGDFNKDWPNVALMVITSLYMAIKMIEPYNPDPLTLTKLASSVFEMSDIIRVEASLTQMFGGLLYSKNLFNTTLSENRLVYAFDNIIRNCHLYHRIDLDRWLSDGAKFIILEPPINKNLMFSEFIKKTNYYQLYQTQDQKQYLQNLYNSDLMAARK